MQKLLFTLLSFWIFSTAMGQAGSLDPAFGSEGLKTADSPVDLSNYQLVKNLPADDGGRYAIYSFYVNYMGMYFTDLVVVKYLQDGSLDLAYGNNGFSAHADMNYVGAVRQSNGVITVAGGTNLGLHDDGRIVRFNPDGTIGTNLLVGGIGSYYEFLQSVFLQNDWVLVPGRSQSLLSGTGGYFVYAFGPNGDSRSLSVGEPYNSFNEPFPSRFGEPLKVAMEGEKLVVEGPLFFSPEGLQFGNYIREQGVARYNLDGTLDATFGNNGKMPAGSYTFPALFDDAYILKTTTQKMALLSTVANTQTGNTDFVVTVYNRDGSPDKNFGNEGSAVVDFGGNDVPKAYVWQNEKLIVGGNSTNPKTGVTSFALARFNKDGSLDPSFDADGKQFTYREGYNFNLQWLAIQKNGLQDRLLAVGAEVMAVYFLEDNVTLACTQNKVVPTDKGLCSAVVSGIDPVLTPSGSGAVVNYTLTGATVGSGSGSVSGKTFNKGVTTVSYALAGSTSQTCSFTVTVEDREAPVISNLAASTSMIWPANHKMVNVAITYNVKDNCGATAKLGISSNESQAGTGADDAPDDWTVLDEHHIQLRAERSGNGSGRVYTVTIAAEDAAGNKSQQTLSVVVPKSMGNNNSSAGAKDDENKNGLQVKVLSNPATDHFTLLTQSSRTTPLTLRIADAQGRTIESRGNLNSGTLQFGSNYRPGVYYVEVQQGTERQLLKLVKLAF